MPYPMIDRRTALLAGAALLGTRPALAQAAADALYGPDDAGARRGGTLTVAIANEPPNLDPFHQAGDARTAVTVLMYQGLMYEHASGTAKPLLAETMAVSDDGLTYTFALRRGVRFHTGQPMTAADVKYSYDYVRNPSNGSPGAADFGAIAGIETPDDHTVVIRLSEPNASLPMTLTNRFGCVVPRDTFANPQARTRLSQQSVGTGPFMLQEFRPQSHIRMARFANYWQSGQPYLDGILFSVQPNAASVLVALRSRRVDLALLARPQDAEQLQGQAGLAINAAPSLRQCSLDLDCNHAQLRDPRVRRAIALSIDKHAVMQAAIGGKGKVLGTIPAAMQESWGAPIDTLPNQRPDAARARALLAEAGLADGFAMDLVSIIGFEWMDPAAVTIAQQLAPLGIRLNIQRVELGVWLNAFRTRNMRFTFNDWGTQPDPHILYYRHFHGAPRGADFRNWNNAEADRLLDAGMATPDPAKRKEAYVAFQRVMDESVPTVMLYSPDLVTVAQARVRNYVQHPTGWWFGLAKAWIAA
ncbi:ABC transporter substrate-binding protein [Roseomonas hellenica]|uniref:ABC transporter substrate-binding protein n=1 Tax=Plastoroseomonas hellenica TaxID=2687306 RepID=A0ABS5F135_9PROT|nr:ABC transporter substrate-binding protein [Plastoroseomonas hellenica]MBR0666288.1 ABC transporter substrate-binding protein [Plastoroseomonas hellenica]